MIILKPFAEPSGTLHVSRDREIAFSDLNNDYYIQV